MNAPNNNRSFIDPDRRYPAFRQLQTISQTLRRSVNERRFFNHPEDRIFSWQPLALYVC